jgi:hypothetical protein
MSATTPKICVNCAHMTSVAKPVCRKEVDLVTGDAVDCRIVRNDDTKCGPEGNWYVDREADMQSSAIETPKATIRQAHDRPWEKGDYIKDGN